MCSQVLFQINTDELKDMQDLTVCLLIRFEMVYFCHVLKY